MDANGLLDVISLTDEAVRIHYQRQARNFDPQEVAKITAPIAAAVLDINEDGKRDLVISTKAGTRAFLQRDRGFVETTKFPIRSAAPERLVAEDFDGDGQRDLVAVQAGQHKILFRDGGTWKIVDLAWQRKTDDLLVHDVDGDGRLDFVRAVSNANASIEVWTQKASRTFSNTTALHFPQSSGVVDQLALADFNDDGRLDLLRVHGKNAHVYTARANGSFVEDAKSAPALAFTGSSVFVTVGDSDGDGDPDVLWAGTEPGYLRNTLRHLRSLAPATRGSNWQIEVLANPSQTGPGRWFSAWLAPSLHRPAPRLGTFGQWLLGPASIALAPASVPSNGRLVYRVPIPPSFPLRSLAIQGLVTHGSGTQRLKLTNAAEHALR